MKTINIQEYFTRYKILVVIKLVIQEKVNEKYSSLLESPGLLLPISNEFQFHPRKFVEQNKIKKFFRWKLVAVF